MATCTKAEALSCEATVQVLANDFQLIAGCPVESFFKIGNASML